EGRELKQRVEAELPGDVAAVDSEEHVYVRAELNRVRGDREVRLGLDLRPVVVEQADAQTLECRQAERRRPERGMKAADREQEPRVVAPLEADCHVSLERGEHDVGVEQ